MALERVAHRFVGRGDELGRLRSLVTLAAGGEPRVILVSGDAGVGKSTLLSRFARTAVDEIGARVLVGSCLPIGGHGVPFAPFVEIARSLATGSALDTTPSSGPPSDQRTPLFSELAVRPTVLYQSTLELLGGLAATEPLVVVIEDLHWADGSTLDLFTYLVANFRTEPVLLIASYRTDGLARDHALRSIVSEWVRSHRVERLPLEPFDRPLVAAQIALLTPSRPTAETVDRVMERTQGNPYFVEELVAADCLDGRPLPASLRELLLVRADVVTAAARRTLRVLSAAADDIDDATLARAADLPVGSVREHVREGLDRRLLVATPTGVRDPEVDDAVTVRRGVNRGRDETALVVMDRSGVSAHLPVGGTRGGTFLRSGRAIVAQVRGVPFRDARAPSRRVCHEVPTCDVGASGRRA